MALERAGSGGAAFGPLAGRGRVASPARLSLRRVETDGATFTRLFADPRLERLEALELEMDRLPTPDEAQALVEGPHSPRFWRVPKSARKVFGRSQP